MLGALGFVASAYMQHALSPQVPHAWLRQGSLRSPLGNQQSHRTTCCAAMSDGEIEEDVASSVGGDEAEQAVEFDSSIPETTLATFTFLKVRFCRTCCHSSQKANIIKTSVAAAMAIAAARKSLGNPIRWMQVPSG